MWGIVFATESVDLNAFTRKCATVSWKSRLTTLSVPGRGYDYTTQITHPDCSLGRCGQNSIHTDRITLSPHRGSFENNSYQKSNQDACLKFFSDRLARLAGRLQNVVGALKTWVSGQQPLNVGGCKGTRISRPQHARVSLMLSRGGS